MSAVTTTILPKNLLDAVKKVRPLYAFGRKARFTLGSYMGVRDVPELGKAHYNDFMLSSADAAHVQSYRRGALAFVDILKKAVAEAGNEWNDIEGCLEIGCGYGRIVREMVRTLPPKTISVCDVIEEGARFTSAQFGVKHVPLVEQMGPSFDGTFDLVYLLSVYTHLPQALLESNMAQVNRILRKDGVVVFTTHGDGSARTAERYNQYWLDKGKVLAELDRTGFYYERYPYYYADYGLTWMKPETVHATVAKFAPDLEFVAHHPLALDEHQDVFVFRKR